MLHQHVTNRGAGFVRVWIFSIWIVYLLGNNPQHFADLPRDQYAELGILRILPDSFYDLLLTNVGLHTLKWLLLTGLVACAVGVRPWRAVAIPTVLLLTIHQSLARGFFYVNHKELTTLYAAYVLAAFPATGFSPFASRDRPDRSERDQAMTRLMMTLLALVMLIPYALIGTRRLAVNDLSLWSGDLLSYYTARHSFGSSWYGMAPLAESVVTRPGLILLLKLGFPIVTVAEVLAPLCLIDRRFRRLWLPIMAGFHVATFVLMDIFFWESLLMYPVLLVDGELLLRWFDRLRGASAQPANMPPAGNMI